MKCGCILKLIMAVVASTVLGCGHISYNQGEMSANAYDIDRSNEGLPRVGGITARYHEIMLLDNTGLTQAALMTSLDQAASAAEAEREARKKTVDGSLRGPVEYQYKVHSAHEFSGLPFGIYYRWTDEQSLAYEGEILEAELDQSRPTYGEFGIVAHAEGVKWPDYGLGIAIGTRLYGGLISGNDSSDGEEIYFALPIQGGVYFAPWWTFGLYAKAEIGLELVTALANYKYGFGQQGRWRPWEYVVETGYKINFTEWASAGANITWAHRNATWGDYWMEFEDLQAGVYFGVDYLALFK